MKRIASLTRTSVGKKIAMAASGLLLFGFVVVHLAGNLKVYQGPEKFNAYAEFLRAFGHPVFGHGQFLWIARAVLLVAVGVHIWAAVRLALSAASARGGRYKKLEPMTFSYASRTMRWGGVIILLFVVWHLLDLTLGTVHPNFKPESPYDNLVNSFRVWPVALFYMLAMVPLGMHIYHGVWSATQTLALTNVKLEPWRRPLALAVAAVIVLGNVSMPLAVLAGVVR